MDRASGWSTWRWPLLGAVVGAVLLLAPADSRAHALGRTDRLAAEVVAAEVEPGCDGDGRASYELVWVESGVPRLGELRRCGPLEHEVGERVVVWVSPSRDQVTDVPPWQHWLRLVGGLALFGLLLGALDVWRRRVWARRVERRRGTSAPRGPLEET